MFLVSCGPAGAKFAGRRHIKRAHLVQALLQRDAIEGGERQQHEGTHLPFQSRQGFAMLVPFLPLVSCHRQRVGVVPMG